MANYDFAAANNVDSSAKNFVYCGGAADVSGNYPSQRGTLDFHAVADKLPSDTIMQVFAESQNGKQGVYIHDSGNGVNNWKLKAFAGGADGDYARSSGILDL